MRVLLYRPARRPGGRRPDPRAGRSGDPPPALPRPPIEGPKNCHRRRRCCCIVRRGRQCPCRPRCSRCRRRSTTKTTTPRLRRGSTRGSLHRSRGRRFPHPPRIGDAAAVVVDGVVAGATRIGWPGPGPWPNAAVVDGGGLPVGGGEGHLRRFPRQHCRPTLAAVGTCGVSPGMKEMAWPTITFEGCRAVGAAVQPHGLPLPLGARAAASSGQFGGAGTICRFGVAVPRACGGGFGLHRRWRYHRSRMTRPSSWTMHRRRTKTKSTIKWLRFGFATT